MNRVLIKRLWTSILPRNPRVFTHCLDHDSLLYCFCFLQQTQLIITNPTERKLKEKCNNGGGTLHIHLIFALGTGEICVGGCEHWNFLQAVHKKIIWDSSCYRSFSSAFYWIYIWCNVECGRWWCSEDSKLGAVLTDNNYQQEKSMRAAVRYCLSFK